MRYCKKCGNPPSDSAKFCAKCGNKTVESYAGQRNAPYVPPKKDNTMIILIVVLAVVALIAVAAACFVIFGGFGNASGGKKAADSSAQVTQSPQPKSTSTPMPTSTPTPIPTPTPAYYGFPVFQYAVASATTTPTKSSRDYAADLVLDGRGDTAWNFTGTGGQWIQIYSGDMQEVHGVKILNGYCKYSPDYNEWLYYKNNRPHNITISFSTGESRSYSLSDVFNPSDPIYQDIEFNDSIVTSYIQITVDSVYRGSTWNDTAISEISAY